MTYYGYDANGFMTVRDPAEDQYFTYTPDVTGRLGSMAIMRVEGEQTALINYLDSGPKRAWRDDRVALRAVRIAFHTNRNGLKQMLLQGKSTAQHEIDREFDGAAAEASAYSDRLIGLRLHHQLALLQLSGYKDLVAKLAYPA